MAMRYKVVFLVGILLWQQYQVDAKIFKDNCELVRALRPYHMPHDLANCKSRTLFELKKNGNNLTYFFLTPGVCLIIAESTRNTAATHRNNDGSIDYGLFQVNIFF
jgi:hypothetical protein